MDERQKILKSPMVPTNRTNENITESSNNRDLIRESDNQVLIKRII